MKIVLIALLILLSGILISYFMCVVRMIYAKEKVTLIQMFMIALISFAIVIAYLLVLTRVLERVLY